MAHTMLVGFVGLYVGMGLMFGDILLYLIMKPEIGMLRFACGFWFASAAVFASIVVAEIVEPFMRID